MKNLLNAIWLTARNQSRFSGEPANFIAFFLAKTYLMTNHPIIHWVLNGPVYWTTNQIRDHLTPRWLSERWFGVEEEPPVCPHCGEKHW